MTNEIISTIDHYRFKILLSLSIVQNSDNLIVINSRKTCGKEPKWENGPKIQDQMSIFTCLLPVTLSKYSYGLNKTLVTIAWQKSSLVQGKVNLYKANFVASRHIPRDEQYLLRYCYWAQILTFSVCSSFPFDISYGL